MRLSMCRERDRVVVQRIYGTSALRKRLLEMGFVSGTCVTVVRYAPLRDPMELQIGGAHVSLRVEEAAAIEVEPVDQRKSQ